MSTRKTIEISAVDSLPVVAFRNLSQGGKLHVIVFRTARAAQLYHNEIADREHIADAAIVDAAVR